jgi:RNA polymerase sigma-70 factor (sigma-E family)
VTFEEYARARLGALLRLARGMTLDAPLAEDLVQDVLIKVQRHWAQISLLDFPDPYVRRMLVNEFISWRRKWGRIQPSATVEPTEVVPDLADAYADRLLLRAELVKLPRRQRAVLALRYYGGLSDAEIAQAMGCTPGTVRGYAARALQALRVELADQPIHVEGR